MCGIAGLWNPQHVRTSAELKATAKAMLSCLRHRGPDDEGIWQDETNPLVLGQQRLAIIDLSPAGHQPMLSDDGQIALSFNGEIYNFQDLRADLVAQGVRFRSDSDTEVLLKGYEHWGTDVLSRLVGMFAFAIWDRRKRQLFLARDRAGEKPLYYALNQGGIAFASEIQALREVPGIDLSIDREALALYLNFQYVPSPFSIYKDVKKLPPAHAMLVTEAGHDIWRYWDPIEFAAQDRLVITEAEALERLEALLIQAVKGQMIADVPLGAFLSGGIDSSTVVSIMKDLASGPVKTFTIGFDVAGYDEAEHAAEVAAHLGTDHTTEYLTEQDSLDLISKLPAMYGEPFADASALPTHLVSMVARKHVTVSLSGDGGDEAFGGYTRYNKFETLASYLVPMRSFGGAFRPILKAMPGRVAGWADYLGLPMEEVYHQQMSMMAPRDVAQLLGIEPHSATFSRSWQELAQLSERRRAMMTDMLTYMPEAVLTKVDRAAMAISLETRAPLLDHRLLEFSLRLPDALVDNKALLKSFVYKKIPQKLLDRPKQGFGVPLGTWLANDLKDMMVEMLSKERLAALGIDNHKMIARLISEFLAGTKRHKGVLWTLLILSLWHEQVREQPAAYAVT